MHNAALWKVCIWYRLPIINVCAPGSFTYAGTGNCEGCWREGREYSNLSRWIGSFATAVLSRLLNKVFCCPQRKHWDCGGRERERERKNKGHRGGARATERERRRERQGVRRGWQTGRETGQGQWRVRERQWDEHLRKSSSQSHSPERRWGWLWPADPVLCCTVWKGPITGWVMGLCHCRLCVNRLGPWVFPHVRLALAWIGLDWVRAKPAWCAQHL